MKKAIKALLITLALFGLIFVIIVLALFGPMFYSAFNTISKTDTNLDNYEMYRAQLHYAEDFLPASRELASIQDLHFAYQKNFMLMFISKTVAVTVQYSPAEYECVKHSISEHFDFLDAPIMYHNDYEVDNAFTYKGYDFCVVSYDGCRYFGMVGTNDDTCSIAYLYYSDTDRDYIAEADEDLDQEMCALIDDEFCWEPFCE